MQKQALIIGLLVFMAKGAAAEPAAISTGPGHGTLIDNPAPDTICPGGTLQDNTDGSYENGYAWAYSGVSAPYFGAWAEGFTKLDPAYGVCGVKLAFTQVGYQDGLLMDIYVWDDSGSNPNNVLSVTTGVNPGTIATWPQISQHDVEILGGVEVPDSYFVGFWGNWPGLRNGWYTAADEDGFGNGLPRTYIAYGIGFPSGWQHPNVVSTFARCMDLGIASYESYIIGPDVGACCYADGNCAITYPGDCAGLWYGIGYDCTPGLCTTPGACCRPGGICTMEIPGACTDGYFMPQYTCDPNPCSPVAAQPISWGRVKALYR